MNEEIKPLRIYVGWDSREDIAYQVCRQSILDHATVPVEIIPLKQKQLKKDGNYWRDEDKLASTEFTFTRFLIPHLNDFKDWALFIDCDFVFLDDVKKLFDQADDQYAIMCAQHDYTPKEGVKMDGKQQTAYPRKNWSSMMLMNCGHAGNQIVTKAFVNDPVKDGKYLHRFSWLRDKEVGKLSHEWNWLVGWYKEPQDGKPLALHYTEGGPWFEQYEECEYAIEWYKAHKRYVNNFFFNLKEQQEKFKYSFGINDLPYSNEIKQVFRGYLNYLVDTEQNFYSTDIKNLITEAEKFMGNKVAAIDSDGGISYKNKGLAYDTYLNGFILGSGGKISSWEREQDTDNALVIRGLGGGSRKALQHCMATGRTFYAIDTGYWQSGRKKDYHRITKNNLQNLGPMIERDGDRLKSWGWKSKRFSPGRKILICPPSNKVMDLWNQPTPEEWTAQIIQELKKYTDRPIEIRLKPNRTERVTNKTIWQALEEDVHCLITYNSIAATEALLAGKPAIALGPNAAQVLCNSKLSEVERLNIPSQDEMVAFARHLSYCQFTEREMQTGYAWEIVNENASS